MEAPPLDIHHRIAGVSYKKQDAIQQNLLQERFRFRATNIDAILNFDDLVMCHRNM